MAGAMGIGLCNELLRTGPGVEGRMADTSAFVEVETGLMASRDTVARKWRIMKNSPLEVHRATRQTVRWERVSPPLAWCRDDSVDRDGQRRP